MTIFYRHLISELSYKFPLIGLSETKISIDKELIPNINIPGYTFISEPSHFNAGGVAFYINDNLKYIIKSNYTKSTYDFEALWIEIDFTTQSNIICGVIYRHPCGNLDNFMDYINSTIESINQENKVCLFMGDFNVDLLKIDSHLLCSIIFFTEVSEVHQYKTRSAEKQSHYHPKVRPNYGKFNKTSGARAPVIWNAINEQVKAGSLSKIKLSLKEQSVIILMRLY